MAENGSERLDRIERLLERMAERHEADHNYFIAEQKALLKVMANERATREAAYQAERETRIEADKSLDSRIEKLVTAIGEFISRLPLPGEPGA